MKTWQPELPDIDVPPPLVEKELTPADFSRHEYGIKNLTEAVRRLFDHWLNEKGVHFVNLDGAVTQGASAIDAKVDLLEKGGLRFSVADLLLACPNYWFQPSWGNGKDFKKATGHKIGRARGDRTEMVNLLLGIATFAVPTFKPKWLEESKADADFLNVPLI